MAVSVSTGTTRGRSGPSALLARNTALLRVTFDSAYLNGGEPFSPSQYVGFTPAAVFVQQREPVTGGYVVVYDHAAETLNVFWVDTTVDGAALAEVANNTNLSALVVDVLVVGD